MEPSSILPAENHEINSGDLRSESVQTFMSLLMFVTVALMPNSFCTGGGCTRKRNKYLRFYWDAVYLSAARKPALLVRRGKWWLPWLPKSAASTKRQESAGKRAWSGISEKMPSSQTASSSSSLLLHNELFLLLLLPTPPFFIQSMFLNLRLRFVWTQRVTLLSLLCRVRLRSFLEKWGHLSCSSTSKACLRV